MAFAQQSAPTTVTSIGGVVAIICTAVGWMFTFLIVLAVVFVLVAAFKYLTAAGDPEKVKSASHTLIYAGVAVAVAILAKGFPLIIGSFFGAGFSGC
jgi:uncharacterized membrane protein